jgi:hypothetical protein
VTSIDASTDEIKKTNDKRSDKLGTTLLEMYGFFFCENLVDFNETRLHEATLNLHCVNFPPPVDNVS